ncbi:MAG: FHA domain-containing protein, partial [Acidimicrobiales bacterium]
GYPEQGGYPDQGSSGYPEQGGYPDQGSSGYPEQGGYPDQGSSGYPDQGGYQGPSGYPDQGGYPPPLHEQHRSAEYGGGQGYDHGYRPGPGGYGPPGGQPGYGDYGRGPERHDEGGYGHPEQRPAYPDQGGSYDPGYQGEPSYGRQDYGQPPAGRYAEPPSGYAEPAGGGYDYGQPPAQAGYDSYGGQSGYSSPGSAVTLQLDDGSGRTYQLRQGSNVVGRGQDAQFRLPDTGVSRRHLEISWDGQVALLSDLNSTNGTTVNNAPVQEWQLADGDVIRLGHSEIVVRVH